MRGGVARGDPFSWTLLSYLFVSTRSKEDKKKTVKAFVGVVRASKGRHTGNEVDAGEASSGGQLEPGGARATLSVSIQ